MLYRHDGVLYNECNTSWGDERMDIRVLRYFLVVAQEESFSRAADALYLSQPTLSRQIREMEEELGVQLLVRTNRSVHLTQEGMRLRNRAQEIVSLMDKTREEFSHGNEETAGDIYIGCGETQIMRRLAQVMIPLQRSNPGIRFHLHSANADDVTEKLDRGLLDFGLLVDPYNLKQYESIPLPEEDTFGFLMRKDHPLAEKAELRITDVEGEPLLIPGQGSTVSARWPASIFGLDASKAHIVRQYNLLFNAALMVEEGMGIALCLDRLADTSDRSLLTFRPLAPRRQSRFYFVWKKYRILSPAAELFLQRMQRELTDQATPLPGDWMK